MGALNPGPGRFSFDANNSLQVTGGGAGAALPVNLTQINGSAVALSNALPVELSDGTNPFGTVSNPLRNQSASEGTTGAAVPSKAGYIGVIDPNGNLQGMAGDITGRPNVNAFIAGTTPAFLQGGVADFPGGGGPGTFTFTNPITKGSMILITLRIGTLSAPTDNHGNLYTPISIAGNIRAFYALNCEGGNTTITYTGASAQATFSEYSGVALSNALDQTAAATGSGAAWSVGPVTTDTNNELVVAYGDNSTSNTPAMVAGAGFTRRSGTNNNAFLEDQVMATKGSVTPTASSSSVTWNFVVATFRPLAALPVNQGIPGANNEAWPSKQIVTTDGDVTLVPLRTPNIFKTATATAAGNTAVWTPTTGKKFRLMRFIIQVQGPSTIAAGGVVAIQFQDGAGAILHIFHVFIPAVAFATAVMLYDSGPIDLGNGYLSVAANNVLNINLGTALTAGGVDVFAIGTEE